MFKNVSFIMIDDNVSMLKIVREILRSYGADQIHAARDVVSAFETVREQPVDIAIIDYNMPFLGGLEFARLIRNGADTPNPFLPIIMLSAHSDWARIQEARDAGVTEFCAKPVSALELARKIDNIVLKPRPFVRAPGFFGPDRRRRAMAYTGRERRAPRD